MKNIAVFALAAVFLVGCAKGTADTDTSATNSVSAQPASAVAEEVVASAEEDVQASLDAAEEAKNKLQEKLSK